MNFKEYLTEGFDPNDKNGPYRYLYETNDSLTEGKIPDYGITRIEAIDPMKNKKKLNIGTNSRGKFFINLIDDNRTSFMLANLMFRSNKGTDESGKILKDALTKAYVSSKNDGQKILDALLKTTQLKNTNYKFKVVENTQPKG